MRGYNSNTTQRKILYLKMILPLAWVPWLQLFYFDDIPCVLSMINSHLMRHRVSLYKNNYLLILINSSLTVTVLKKYWLWTLIGQAGLKNKGHCLHEKKTNNGPSIEPCVTPHLISSFNISTYSVILLYCFLPLLESQARFVVITAKISIFL